VNFTDHFSKRAALYAAYRPHYPTALFDFVAALTPHHHVALDCGTGNGQAAVGLADHFDRVIAIDASSEQIRNAVSHPKIELRVARADATRLDEHSVNLVTAAQALHWFDRHLFFSEARRVLSEDGAIAVWGYGDPVLDLPKLDATLHHFNRGTLEPYWPAERQILLAGYRDVDFPFIEVPTPHLELTTRWNLWQLAGYLRTWSATERYVNAHDIDPVNEVERSLAVEWGDPQASREIRWPLYIRAGRL